MEVALIFAAFALVVAYAIFEAWMDNERIQAHERIDHIEGWVIRAIVTIFLWMVASFKIGYSAIPCVIGSAFLFSAVFRYSLNGMRGLDWRYVSPSSWYDWQFICHTLGWVNKMNYRVRVREFHGINYFEPVGTPEYPVRIHRAGTIAYITEATITTACVLWVVFA
jgi:hypothetical protein